jgi:predicted phosphodiesterase
VFAAIADVHGNRWALEAVLEDIHRRGINQIFNAGDHLWGPLDAAGTADLLMGLDLPSVAGNQDREPIEGLSTQHRQWLAKLPTRLELPGGILMFHGTPERDDVYLLESVRNGGEVSLASTEEIAQRLCGVTHPLMLCGHTHLPRIVSVGGSVIVNPGSVGLQAYGDDLPVKHVMETGSPHARYAVLKECERDWHIEQIAIRYDWDSAARAAEANGRPDWAWRLRTGRAALPLKN